MINSHSEQIHVQSSEFRNTFETILQTMDDSNFEQSLYFSRFSLKKLFNPCLFHEIVSNNKKRQTLGLICLRNFLFQEIDGPVQKIIDENLVPKLVEFLEKDEYPYLQIESAKVLNGIICLATTEQIQTLIDFVNLLPPIMIKLLNSSNFDVTMAVILFSIFIQQFSLK